MSDQQTQNMIFASLQQLEEQKRDKSFDRVVALAFFAFFILALAWAVDQVLIQIQIWYQSAAVWF